MILSPKYLSAPKEETIIWRYMDLPKMISLFIKRALWFTRLDKLTDEFEGTVPLSNKLKILYSTINIKTEKDYEKNIDLLQDSIQIISNIKESVYINSWSIGEFESFALWKIYLSQSKYGIALRSNVRDFNYSLSENGYNIIPIEVKYYNQSREGLKNIEIETISGSKSSFYEYEKEFRAIIIDQSQKGLGENPKMNKSNSGIYVPVYLPSLFDSIYISPGAPDWFYDIVCYLRDSYHLSQKVCRSKIKEKL